ncbi:MAG: iron uptake system component EfeO, partial [Actinomycetota bacterium]|nr:iron uptake system component EfeO [Actinomycetota bacterium]
TFAVTNDGSKVTEVYVYAKSGDAFTKVISEVENIGPGTSRDLDVDLSAGTYEVACKPGQKGDGIRQKVTVTGPGAGSSASPSEKGYDRELELSVDNSGLAGLDPATADQGEKIEFKLENETDGTRTFELKDPAGKVATEFDVPAGKEGEAVVELADSGDWTVIIEGGSADIEQTLTVGP